MATPETYESINLKPNAPRGCPWKNTVVSGPMAGQVTFKTVPCQKEHCELWWEQAGRCALSMIAPSLLDLHSRLHFIADQLASIAHHQ